MLERDIEQYLVREVLKLSGLCEKFTSPGRRSVPDRLVTLPNLPMFLVELKAPGKEATTKQQRDHEKRRALGIEVYVVDTKEKVDVLLAHKMRGDAGVLSVVDPTSDLWRILV